MCKAEKTICLSESRRRWRSVHWVILDSLDRSSIYCSIASQIAKKCCRLTACLADPADAERPELVGGQCPKPWLVRGFFSACRENPLNLLKTWVFSSAGRREQSGNLLGTSSLCSLSLWWECGWLWSFFCCAMKTGSIKVLPSDITSFSVEWHGGFLVKKWWSWEEKTARGQDVKI